MNGTAKKILFIEDEPNAQIAYRNRLQRDGFETLFAEDGAVALNRLSEFRPDLLVLDLMLPKANGAEVLRHVRSQEGLKETPVLVLSNDYVSELSQNAMASGATRGILKTECTPAKLAETVRDMLGYASPFDLSDKPMSDESQAEAFIAAASEACADEVTLKETREEFLRKAPEEMAKIREYCLAYIKAGATPAGLECLDNLFQHVRFFATRAGLSGCVRIALLASAFEALLFEIVFKPGRATASILQTVAQAVDSLERLCQKAGAGAGEPNLKARILIVDDDAVSNRAMMIALKRAHFEPVSLEDPARAVETAQATPYDIVLLDINMEGINGYELCEMLRAMPEYKQTPILFVSSSGDFQSRARCILSGGNEIITKPVSPVELVLKTTIRLVQPHGLWPEASTAANAQRLTAESHSANVPSEDAPIPFDAAKLAPSETCAPGAADNGPSFSTEIIKKAWSGSEPSKPIELDKLVPAETPNGMGQSVNDGENQPSDSAETIQSPAPEILTEPVTLVDEEKLRQIEELTSRPLGPEKLPDVNGENKTDELKSLETMNELPDMENPPAPVTAPQPDQPMPLANQTATLPDPEPPQTTLNMETKNKPTLDEVTRGVARIIFGDENITDMNVRLTRIALERYNVQATQNFDEATRGIAQIIFGDDKITDMNVRLTRIALERYNVTEVPGLPNGSTKPVENGASLALSSF